MITKIKDERGYDRIAIVLNYECIEEILNLQDAILWAIKSLADSDSLCGKSPEIWELTNLLGYTLLTAEQTKQVERLLFKD